MEERYSNHFIEFGNRLRDIRKARGLTLLDLEVSTGISNGTLSKIENGLRNIEFLTILKLAETLDVEPIDLFNYKDAIPTDHKKK
jgi:transcriptional regulator with XRE-family HTH domain